MRVLSFDTHICQDDRFSSRIVVLALARLIFKGDRGFGGLAVGLNVLKCCLAGFGWPPLQASVNQGFETRLGFVDDVGMV